MFTAAEEIEAAGGKALPIVGDIRDEASVEAAVAKTVETFGGIDIASTTRPRSTSPDDRGSAGPALRPDAVDQHARDVRRLRACIPHLKAAENPHILTLSPPISLEPKWLGGHIGYTLSKYGMSLLALGLAEELKDDGIASNALWPRTLIATAAVQNLLGGDAAMAVSRKPELYADAAYAVLTKPSRECTGNTFLCEDVLAGRGRHRFDQYAYVPAPPRRWTSLSTTSDRLTYIW